MQYVDEGLLLRHFQEGDNNAVQKVYNLFKRELWWSLHKKVKDTDLIDDIVAESFSRLFNRRCSYDRLEHLKRSLYIIARNLIIDHIRLRNRQQIHRDAAYYSTPIWDEENVAILRELVFKQIHADIEKLPPQRKEVIKLYFFQQMDTREVAEKMGLSPQTCLNHKTRALQDLKYKFLQDL